MGKSVRRVGACQVWCSVADTNDDSVYMYGVPAWNSKAEQGAVSNLGGELSVV